MADGVTDGDRVTLDDVTDVIDGANEVTRALQELDVSARLERRASPYCNYGACLCGYEAVLHGHRIRLGHTKLDGTLDAPKVCQHIATTPCSCCKKERARAKQQSNEKRTCNVCKQPGHLVRDCPASVCFYCGGKGHLSRECTFGSSTRRADSFLTCSSGCFIRRFLVPLHRARLDFDVDDLTAGRVDLAARLVSSSLVSSQRLRHNTQLWMPFLGDDEPTSVCVTGGLVRGLHPSERDTACRLRRALDHLASRESSSEGGTLDAPPPAALSRELRGFSTWRGGLASTLVEALRQARDEGTHAPVLLLCVGAPPLSRVLDEHIACNGPLRDLLVVLGDDIGLSAAEEAEVERVGAEASGGGDVLRASLGSGCLLASHCIVLVHHYLDALHECPSQLWEAPSADVTRVGRQGRDRRRRRTQKQQQQQREGGGMVEEDGDVGAGDDVDGDESDGEQAPAAAPLVAIECEA